MPHAHPSMLLPGEVLLIGEFLVSDDGRFRVYLEESGSLVAYAYRSDRGIQRFWSAGLAGPGAKLQLAPQPNPSGGGTFCGLVLTDAHGNVVWSPSDRSFWVPTWQNLFFVIQCDGNLVQYVQAPSTELVKASWSPNTYLMWRGNTSAIPPNTVVCEVPPAGTIILQEGAGDADLVNISPTEQIAARDKDRVVTIPPQQSVSLAIPSTLSIGTDSYIFDDLQAPDGTVPHHESDAVVAVPAPSRPGQRRRIEVGPGGSLALTDAFRFSGVHGVAGLRLTGLPSLGGGAGEFEHSPNLLDKKGEQGTTPDRGRK